MTAAYNPKGALCPSGTVLGNARVKLLPDWRSRVVIRNVFDVKKAFDCGDYDPT
jgi:hypothetical protein